MPRNLTGKQAKFALGVAMGKSLVGSYREAYEPSDPTAASVYANARRARKHPGIVRRIAELQVKLLPGPEDMKAVYQHALAVGLQLSILGKDDRVRLRAAQWVAAEAEKKAKLVREANELCDEETEELEDIPADPAAEGDLPAKSGAEILAELRRAPPVEQEVPKAPAQEIRYVEKCVTPPGHFPVRFVKVAVRNPEGPEGG